MQINEKGRFDLNFFFYLEALKQVIWPDGFRRHYDKTFASAYEN